jgi:hypothetical protein
MSGLSHLAACMPLGFARHGTVHEDCAMSGLIPQGGFSLLRAAERRLTC